MWLILSPAASILLAAIVSASFVLSLYVWRHSLTTDRDQPRVIQQRILSTTVVTLACAPILASIAYPDPLPFGGGPSLLVWLGFPGLSSLVAAVLLPLSLTATLFIGPICVFVITASREEAGGDEKATLTEKVWRSLSSSFVSLWSVDERWKSIRNLVAAPIAEEIVFRGCVLAILVAGGFGFGTCVLLSPVLFGCAHLHHLINLVRARGASWQQGVLMVTFQLAYTTLFGAYAAFVYMRTGHMVAPIAAHVFCNTLGFPELRFLSPYHFLYTKRAYILALFVAGIVIFSLSLWPMTEPRWYTNEDGTGPWLLKYQEMQRNGEMAQYTPKW